jgi:hypothetical protein
MNLADAGLEQTNDSGDLGHCGHNQHDGQAYRSQDPPALMRLNNGSLQARDQNTTTEEPHRRMGCDRVRSKQNPSDDGGFDNGP